MECIGAAYSSLLASKKLMNSFALLKRDANQHERLLGLMNNAYLRAVEQIADRMHNGN
jgi:hypothetical protein